MAEERLPIYQAAYQILGLLIENSANSENRRLTYREVFAATGLDAELFGAAYDYLRRSGYIMAPISDEDMWATAKGMEAHFRERTHDFLDAHNKWLENFSRSLQQPNPLSAPTSNVINNYGSMHYPQIQQGATRSSQTSSSTPIPIDDLHNLLDEIQASLSELGDDNRREAEAAITAIETQLSSPPPNHGFVRGRLESIQRIFEGTTSSAFGSGLAPKIAEFIASYMESA